MEQYKIIDGERYAQSLNTKTLDGKPFTVRNFIPIFKSEEERETTRSSIRNELFNVFYKYMS